MDLLSDLNKAQRQAVTHGKGPLLIVAGAGTGKTTVVARRFASLVQEGKAKADEILAITFTEKAAQEMEERISQLLPLTSCELWISTIHSFCERVLRDHGLDIGLPVDFEILNASGQWLFMRRHFNEFNLNYYRPLGNATKFIKVLLDHFSRVKDEAITPEEYLSYVKSQRLNSDNAEAAFTEEAERLEEIAHAYHTYQALKLQERVLDFGDLLMYTLLLFKRRKGVLEYYRKKFSYILVDEFQDTNWVQYELMKLLAAPENNLTVVGDDEQSVYAFRGASMSNILHFKDDFQEAEEVVLTENYRSKKNILSLAYEFIQQNNPNRLEYSLKIPKKLKAQRPGEAIIQHLHAPSVADEAQAVVEKISSLKDQDPEASWRDFAILVRANSQADYFVAALETAQIPYQFLASSGLYSKPVILDVIAYLKLLDNYHESSAMYRILSMPSLKLDYEDLHKLTHLAQRKGWSLYEACEKASLASVTQNGLTLLSRLISRIEAHTRAGQSRPVGQAVFRFLEDFDYLKGITSLAEKGDVRALEQLGVLRQFFKKIQEFTSHEPDSSIRNFLATFEMLLESGDEGALNDEATEGPETVKIMTVHGAKGLEFKYVFIGNLVDLRFPSVERKEPIPVPDALVKEIVPPGDTHLQEERRLLYVAMTRARDGLFFTSADDYGGLRKKKLSRFLIELGYAKPEMAKPTGEVIFSLENRGQIQSSSPRGITQGAADDQNTEPLQITSYQLPTIFSFTQLRAFETCPLQYKFAHILMVPVKGRASFSFGKSIHATLEKFLRQMIAARDKKQGSLFTLPSQEKEATSEEILLKDLTTLYDQCWISDWYEDKKEQEQYKAKGKEMLSLFLKDFIKEHPYILCLEKPFRVKIGGEVIKGVIDRIDKIDSGESSGEQVKIIDYKTGAAKELVSVDKDQLFLYQIAAEESLGFKPVSLEYYFLEGGKKVPFLGTSKELENFKAKVIKIIQEIKASHFSPKPSREKCKYCDFKDICEVRIIS